MQQFANQCANINWKQESLQNYMHTHQLLDCALDHPISLFIQGEIRENKCHVVQGKETQLLGIHVTQL
jgi:hypothetical protein